MFRVEPVFSGSSSLLFHLCLFPFLTSLFFFFLFIFFIIIRITRLEGEVPLNSMVFIYIYIYIITIIISLLLSYFSKQQYNNHHYQSQKIAISSSRIVCATSNPELIVYDVSKGSSGLFSSLFLFLFFLFPPSLNNHFLPPPFPPLSFSFFLPLSPLFLSLFSPFPPRSLSWSPPRSYKIIEFTWEIICFFFFGWNGLYMARYVYTHNITHAQHHTLIHTHTHTTLHTQHQHHTLIHTPTHTTPHTHTHTHTHTQHQHHTHTHTHTHTHNTTHSYIHHQNFLLNSSFSWAF